MDFTIHASYLPQDDPDASLAFYRDTLGFEVRNDVGYQGMRWITVGPADQPATSIVLHPPAVQPSTVDSLIGTALDGGATALKPAKKGFWGYGGVVHAPDG